MDEVNKQALIHFRNASKAFLSISQDFANDKTRISREIMLRLAANNKVELSEGEALELVSTLEGYYNDFQVMSTCVESAVKWIELMDAQAMGGMFIN